MTADALAALRARFLERTRGELAVLEAGAGHPEFRRIVHGLSGAAGLFGFPEVSVRAAVIDDRLAEGRAVEERELAALIAAVRATVA